MTPRTIPLALALAASHCAPAVQAPHSSGPAPAAAASSEFAHSGTPSPSVKPATNFSAQIDDKGVLVQERGRKVLYFRSAPLVPVAEATPRNNYIHPLYSPSGLTLTEDAPEDHPHHRGLFWAWHQVYSEGKRVGDGWSLEGIEWQVAKPHFASDDQGRGVLRTEVSWTAAGAPAGEAFIRESQSIVLHPLKAGIQRIDFELELTALKDGVALGGSENEKGYGGFSPRLAHSERLQFRSASGPVEAKKLQVHASDWMDMDWSEGEAGWPDGVTVFCRAAGEAVTQWILRTGRSMQNCAFPGEKPIELERGQPLHLVASVILRNSEDDQAYWSETLPQILDDLRR